jgi:hypothetical protein
MDTLPITIITSFPTCLTARLQQTTQKGLEIPVPKLRSWG